jgi:4-hydroxyproline epimerase
MTRSVFDCIDAHTCGNPVRVVTSNQPVLNGSTMSEKRQHFLEQYDWIRTGLMFEPRGHDAMSGSIIYPPVNSESDLGVLFIEVSGCLPMCGHGTIGTVTVALEERLVEPKIPGLLKLDTPAGLVEARYEMKNGHVDSVELTNIPSFLHSVNLQVEVPGLGAITLDVSYGGNFYAIVEPQTNYPGLEEFSVDDIRHFSPRLRNAVNELQEFVHPEDKTIRNVSHVMWTDKPTVAEADMRNAVFYGDRGIDRSPCGTGTSARVAQLVNRGDLSMGEQFVHESIICSLFTGCAVRKADIGEFNGIVPTVAGWARITGHNSISIDDRDPYAHGFLLT